MSELVLSLPFPPSGHTLFRKHNGSHLSASYKAWRDEAGAILNIQRHDKITGRVMVTIDLVPPDKRLRDSDNFAKPILDLLVAHRVIEADNNRTVRGHSVYWRDEGIPCRVTVTPLQPSIFDGESAA